MNSREAWPKIDDLWIDENKPHRAAFPRLGTEEKEVWVARGAEGGGKRKHLGKAGVEAALQRMDHMFLSVESMGPGRHEAHIHIQTADPAP